MYHTSCVFIFILLDSLVTKKLVNSIINNNLITSTAIGFCFTTEREEVFYCTMCTEPSNREVVTELFYDVKFICIWRLLNGIIQK